MNAGRLIVMALFSFYIVVLALLTPKRQPPREPSPPMMEQPRNRRGPFPAGC